MAQSEIMTVKECAKYLKMSPSTIYKLAQDRKMPATKVGRQWRFRSNKIDQWLDKSGSRRNGQVRQT